MRTLKSEGIEYMRGLYAKEDAVLKQVTANLSEKFLGWQIGSEEGKFLHFLVKTQNIKTIVEIGTLAGYSAIWMARALPEGGMLYGINNDKEHIALAKQNFAASDVANRITLLEGNAEDILQTLTPKAPFDMVFIDADKQNYPVYLDWAEANVRKGGLIIGDNTLLFGTIHQDPPPKDDIAPTTWKAMRTFNERLSDESKYLTTFIPTEEGMTVAVKLF